MGRRGSDCTIYLCQSRHRESWLWSSLVTHHPQWQISWWLHFKQHFYRRRQQFFRWQCWLCTQLRGRLQLLRNHAPQIISCMFYITQTYLLFLILNLLVERAHHTTTEYNTCRHSYLDTYYQYLPELDSWTGVSRRTQPSSAHRTGPPRGMVQASGSKT